MTNLSRSVWPSHIVPTEVAKVLVLAGITCSATLDYCDLIPTEFPGWIVVLLDETIIQLGDGGDQVGRERVTLTKDARKWASLNAAALQQAYTRVKRSAAVLKQAELTAGLYGASIPIEERRERQGADEVMATKLKLGSALKGRYNLSRPMVAGTGAMALSDKERRMRQKAAVKLRRIVEEAGTASELLGRETVEGEAASTLLDSVLGMGAHRTIA